MTAPTRIALGALSGLVILGVVITAFGPTIEIYRTPPSVIRVTDMPMTGSSALPVLSQKMPEFVGITRWWNTENGQALSPEMLKGKVVLLDFWTYSCINCIRTYPFLKTMHERYASKGLVIVGVHTPEFAFEADPKNVEREIQKNGLLYPIALDPAYATWNAYDNHYWPAEYFFDRQGRLRRTHFGEGAYDESERAIRELLQEDSTLVLDATPGAVAAPDFEGIATPETYFGLLRSKAFADTLGRDNIDTSYRFPATLRSNTWALDGTWKFRSEYVQSMAPGRFQFNVQARTLHLVLESADGTDKTLDVYVDGVYASTITVNTSTLYDIATFTDGARHTVELREIDPGVRFYAATFS